MVLVPSGCFGMKLHIGVDSQSGLTHSAVVTAANVHDKHPLPDLLHGEERRVYGDSAYQSQKALIASKAPLARDFTNDRTRRGGEVDEVKRAKNRNKSKVRARVEHVRWAYRKRSTGRDADTFASIIDPGSTGSCEIDRAIARRHSAAPRPSCDAGARLFANRGVRGSVISRDRRRCRPSWGP